MDVFKNCRICLREINHEPIKMTRIIMRFFEKNLQLVNLTQPYPQENAQQNLCAPCFNKISELQDFLEQCKDSDEFWKSQFEDLREGRLRRQLSFEETVLLPLTEDSNPLEADTTVSTTEVKMSVHTQPEEKGDNAVYSEEVKSEHDLQVNQESTVLLTSSQITKEESETQVDEFSNSIDLADWTDDANDDGDIQIDENNKDNYINAKSENEDFIEYEYQIEENEVEIDEITTIESISSDACDVDYRSFAYEKIESEKSSENTIICETTKEEPNEAAQNTFFLTTSIDENGKIKMIYKCPMCDKSFNRIYDIESHSNIHNGIKPFTCNVCGKSFRQKNILTTHQALHFGKTVECSECEKKFARRSQLILHYRMHRDEKPFVCNIDGCEAAFRQRKQLIDHTFIHSSEKNFQCATCEKSFHTRKRLQDHIYKVHSQYRYRCELCEKAFLKPHMLKHHLITVHNVEVDDVSHLKTLINVLKPAKKTIINPK